MKQALILYLFLIPILAFSQINGDFTMDWQPKKEMSFGDFKTNIPYFTGNSFRYDISKKSITLLLNLSQSGNPNTSSVQISNIVYESISISDLGDLSVVNIPEKPNETLKNVSSRDKKQIFLSLSPIIKEGNSFKRIRSFSYNLVNSVSKNTNNSFTQKSSIIHLSLIHI